MDRISHDQAGGSVRGWNADDIDSTPTAEAVHQLVGLSFEIVNVLARQNKSGPTETGR